MYNSYTSHTHTHTHTQSLGQLGRVERLLRDGAVVAVVNKRRWALNANCFIPVPGEELDEEEECKSVLLLTLCSLFYG